MLTFTGPAARRTPDGLLRAAAIIGCEVAALQADVQVEAASSGFDAAGRPKALFEPHVFYRHLQGTARDLAELRGLAYRKWGTRPYPRDSYDRIARAMAIDPEAALMATSWGLPQILGENHGAAGYPSATAMVAAFVAGGEDEHLAAMARFITANPRMRRALCERQWSTFARLYNGPATKGYDVRLAAAYARAGAIGPDQANTHVAISSMRAARTATRVSAGAIAAGTIAAATVATFAPGTIRETSQGSSQGPSQVSSQVSNHASLDLIFGMALIAIAIGLGLAIRAIAFGNKAEAFKAAGAVSTPLVPPNVAVAPTIVAPTPSIVAPPT